MGERAHRCRVPEVLPLLLVLAVLLPATTVACSSVSPNRSGAPSVSGPIPTGDETSEFQGAAAALSRVVVNVEIENAFNAPRGSQLIPTGNGSGIVIRSDGYILTNDHVVAGADNVDVDLGAKHVKARIVGRDPSTDLAVIKVAGSGMSAAAIGDPATLKPGQWVIAVGSPFGLDHTVTTGIISALSRDTLSPDASSAAAYTNLIQTDAAINPGNSGGALGTLSGEVVGVNSIVESPGGSSAGVGFAIPIDFAMSIAKQLIDTGHAVHPYIGVNVLGIDSHVAFELGLDASVQSGALAQQVTPGGPADKAGIRQDDVITSIGGVPVISAATFWAAMRGQRIGATVPVTILRAGKTLTIRVRIGSGRQG
jgi:S1-C subfamily serine protease